PVVRTSALTGMGVGRIVPVLLSVREAWTARASTADVNRVLRAAIDAHPPPRGVGQIRYGTQTSARPPTFVLFGASEPPASYRRYLEHALRRAFGFGGVPVRMRFRPKGSPAPRRPRGRAERTGG